MPHVMSSSAAAVPGMDEAALHFDMALAPETFVSAREETIQAREREISELPTPVLKLQDG